MRFLIGTYPFRTLAFPGPYVTSLEIDLGGQIPIQAAYMSTYRQGLGALDIATSWDHSKLLDVDGRTAMIGGMNWWAPHYIDTANPVNDLSMQVSGPAAADASKFENVLWSWTCAHRNEARYVYFSAWAIDGCISHASVLAPEHSGDVPILTVGRLGNGIPVPDHPNGESPPIAPVPLQGNKCTFLQGNFSDTNTNIDYEYRNPGEDALRALINTASRSIFLSQQDLLSCAPLVGGKRLDIEALFDDRIFAALAAKVARVPITIVLSDDHGGSYSNGFSIEETAHKLTEAVAADRRISYEEARGLVCRHVGIAGVHNGPGHTWANGKRFANHAKLVEVDDSTFYIGSENLYPARLQELGMIVEDPAAAATLKTEYLDPLWRWSSGYAISNPQGACGPF